MLRRFKNAVMRRKKPEQSTVFSATIEPKKTVYAIGDIHGCESLLEQLLGLIDKDIEETNAQNVHLVFLGDYVDRGDHSAEVLSRIFEITTEHKEATTCLRGNHEQMMLDFLTTPIESGARWLRNGGLQTLASYRIGGVSEQATPEQLLQARDALKEALPAEHEAWLRRMPLTWKSGNIVCVHAGMDPNLGVDMQNENNCIWGHRDFLRAPRQDGNWVVFGHITTEEPEARDGRISVDTGAYFSGRLTAAVLAPDSLRFITT